MASRYDIRMAEIAAQRQAEQAGLDRIEQSTETITKGMSDPVNWILCAGAIVGIPFSGGLSLGLGIIAILRSTKGGKAAVQAVQPTPADLASPGAGCARIIAALGSLVILLLLAALFLAAIAYNMGGR